MFVTLLSKRGAVLVSRILRSKGMLRLTDRFEVGRWKSLRCFVCPCCLGNKLKPAVVSYVMFLGVTDTPE